MKMSSIYIYKKNHNIQQQQHKGSCTELYTNHNYLCIFHLLIAEKSNKIDKKYLMIFHTLPVFDFFHHFLINIELQTDLRHPFLMEVSVRCRFSQ